MPLISSFYGILVYMYWLDTKQHHSPHIYAEYAGSEAVFSIAESELLEGAMPPRQTRLLQAWIEIHREELMADWTLAIRGETLVKIDPLRLEKTMNPRITAVTAYDDHTLLLTFTNGEIRHFDITHYLCYPAFEPLRQVTFFKLARASHGTVTWPKEIDFDPDTLYLEGKPAKLEEQAA